MISVPWKWNIPTRSATRQATTFQTELKEREREERDRDRELWRWPKLWCRRRESVSKQHMGATEDVRYGNLDYEGAANLHRWEMKNGKKVLLVRIHVSWFFFLVLVLVLFRLFFCGLLRVFWWLFAWNCQPEKTATRFFHVLEWDGGRQ